MHTTTSIEHIRHTLAHVLAAAVLEQYPKAKLGIGPAIDTGFYYDIKFPRPLREEDLASLEQRMREIISQGIAIKGEKVTPARARGLFKEQPFKLELIKDFSKEKKQLTVYRLGENPLKQKSSEHGIYFLDLCKGSHVKSTSEINVNSFKLLKLAGAYWKGDEKNPQLTRIYGAAFETSSELQAYLQMLENAASRDHRKLGKELGLFIFSDLLGPGLPLYTPKGAGILQRIKDFSRILRKETGYQEVQTPNINKGELFKISGHYEKFKEDMFHVSSHYSEEEYFLKPMNCPQHTQLYVSELRSYRDLPIKYADFALLYRDEKPGELSGLTRLRSFSQDDGHCFCRPDQIEQEFTYILESIQRAMQVYNLKYRVRLSLRDEKDKKIYLGNDATWKRSQKLLEDLLKKKGISYIIAPGEAAFYGPKIDLIVKDSLGREWQLSTIQLDFNMPERFNLDYIDENGKKQRPVMIHSAFTGSPERFFGILLEHYAGIFPFWLTPVQVKILSINEKVVDYAGSVLAELTKANIRTEIDSRNESLGKKIREAELMKIPYVLVVGEKEQATGTVNIRERASKGGKELNIDSLIAQLKNESAHH